MDPESGFVLFNIFLGIFGVYNFAASLVAYDSNNRILGTIHQWVFIAIIFAFMSEGLYYYNLSVPS